MEGNAKVVVLAAHHLSGLEGFVHVVRAFEGIKCRQDLTLCA